MKIQENSIRNSIRNLIRKSRNRSHPNIIHHSEGENKSVQDPQPLRGFVQQPEWRDNIRVLTTNRFKVHEPINHSRNLIKKSYQKINHSEILSRNLIRKSIIQEIVSTLILSIILRVRTKVFRILNP